MLLSMGWSGCGRNDAVAGGVAEVDSGGGFAGGCDVCIVCNGCNVWGIDMSILLRTRMSWLLGDRADVGVAVCVDDV